MTFTKPKRRNVSQSRVNPRNSNSSLRLKTIPAMTQRTSQSMQSTSVTRVLMTTGRIKAAGATSHPTIYINRITANIFTLSTSIATPFPSIIAAISASRICLKTGKIIWAMAGIMTSRCPPGWTRSSLPTMFSHRFPWSTKDSWTCITLIMSRKWSLLIPRKVTG
jgi:hypothetical protein